MIINLEYKKKDPIFAPSKRREGQWCTSLSSMTPRLMTHSADAILSQLFTQDYHYCTDLVISTYHYDVDAASNVVSAVLTDFCNAIDAHPEDDGPDSPTPCLMPIPKHNSRHHLNAA